MEIRIGVTDHPRELTVELADDADRDEVRATIDAALGGASSTLWLTDVKGRDVGIAAARLAWVEMAPSSAHPIGFG